jgi:type III secretory pathway component EscT
VSELAPGVQLWPLLQAALERGGASWQQWLLAWARVLPLVTIVPAFGSRLMPAPARAVFGLGLAGLLVPAIAPDVSSQSHWAIGFIRELFRGLPVALSSGALIWASMMAGGLVDDLRGASQQQSNVFQEARTPLGAFLGLFATGAFLKLGGVESALASLLGGAARQGALAHAAADLVSSLHIAFALCAPVLCVSVVWEVAGALIARAASPAHVQSLLAPLRAMVVLGAFALVLPAVFEFILEVLAARLGAA